MKVANWVDDELPLGTSVRQAAALVIAGLRRPALCFAAIVVLAGVVVGAMVLRRHAYAPTFVMRVVEPERDPGGTIAPRRQLSEYVRQAIFTSEPLFDLIRRHGLYPSLMKKNPRAALDSFREDIEVETYQNYFVEERPVGAAPRSAHLRVSYKNPNSDVAVAVTRELGALVVGHEMAARREQAARTAEQAKRNVAAAREALARRRSEVALAESEIERSGKVLPQKQVELVGMLGSLQALELREDETEKREASFALGAALERHGIGMSFEVVDDASLPTDAAAHEKQIAMGLVWFAAGLPFVTMAVGAFAPKKGHA